jgi:hypothetical protein
VKQALQKLNQDPSEKDDRKRKYHSLNAEVDVTEEDMEAYRIQKDRSLDPMAKISSDEVLDYK